MGIQECQVCHSFPTCSLENNLPQVTEHLSHATELTVESQLLTSLLRLSLVLCPYLAEQNLVTLSQQPFGLISQVLIGIVCVFLFSCGPLSKTFTPKQFLCCSGRFCAAWKRHSSLLFFFQDYSLLYFLQSVSHLKQFKTEKLFVSLYTSNI